MALAVTSKTLPLARVEDLADTRLAQKISQLSGVGLVSISGGHKPAVRIQANPTALSSYGINLDDLRLTLTQATINQAKGSFDGPHQAYQINANDQLLTGKDYSSLVVAYNNGAPVILSDVAHVIDGVENTKLAGWMNKTPAIIVNIQRQPGANTIQVVDRIKKLLPQLKATLPAGIEVSVLTDRTTTIRASVSDVEFSLMLTIALVIMAIFLFLRNLRATIIPSVAVPLSLIGTFGVMYLLGFSLNNLTLMALTISTGFVVDDAIVMIENIFRYLEQGETPLNAALKGARQIGFTIISLTVSLIAVLIPLLFMGDIVGRLFREFAITLSVTILLSALISLTLTPMMCARLLKQESEQNSSRFYLASERVFNRVIEFYGRTLQWVLKREKATLLVAVATLVLTLVLYVVVPKGLFPVQDTGVIQGISEAAQNISFSAMAEKQQALADVLLKDPAVESLSSFIGIDGTNTTLNSGRMLINLKPLSQRKISASDVIRRLQPQLEKVDGVTLYMQSVQDLTVEDRVSRTQFQYTLEDANADELNYWTKKVVEKLRQLPQLRDVATDQLTLGSQARLVIDRITASRLGITPLAIDNVLYDAFGQRQISILFTQLNQYHLILETLPDLQKDPAMLNNIYVNSSSGGPVPLSAFTHFESGTAPLAINRQGQFPSVTISFNLAPGAALGEATNAIEKVQKELAMPLSMQATFQYGGKQRVVSVDLDLKALEANNLVESDVVTAISNGSLTYPSGTAKIGGKEVPIDLNVNPPRIDLLNDLPIKMVGGTVIHISDVAQVRDGYFPQENIVRQDGVRSTLLSIFKNGSASTLSVAAGVKAAMANILKTVTSDIQVKQFADQSVFVKAAVSGVVREGVIAAALTALMILLFLGSWRSTLIIAVSIPLSVLSSLAILSLLGQTINIMTLGGLALAVGILVDDATVTIENVERHLASGEKLEDGILKGAGEIALPAMVSTFLYLHCLRPDVFVCLGWRAISLCLWPKP